ncbi:MAG TPA: NAD-binding protein [Oscillospiraceae bacterium]|nr:NAD-binding protein [Oscillospiraceae bacterium]HPF55516.1 NAD-binding protein [Clostridiales bacterium]HPK35864.1 NAD-binding protein [Oscillospiraceae bacterium]HPR76573.1 NAD-binding protein [Oscillospiraceae bacterium]
MTVVIVGLGKVGYNLAKTLIEGGHKVKMIELRPEICTKVANDLHRSVICGDGSKIEEQTAAETDKADAFIAVTGKDEINLISCQLAKIRFGVKKTVSRVNNPKNLQVVQKLGVDIAVSSTGYIANLIERQLDDADSRFLSTVTAGQVSINEVTVTKGSPLENRMIKELDLPQNCILVSILREGKMIVPRGSVVLLRDDVVVAASPPAYRAEVKQALKKVSGAT